MKPFTRQSEPDQERLGLLHSQQVLGISEFNLFERAYLAWYGVRAQEQELERYYIDYLVSGSVPGWLRQYSRRICREYKIENQDNMAGEHAGFPWLMDILLPVLLLRTVILFISV